jgi:CheY-like chemotaxis protein
MTEPLRKILLIEDSPEDKEATVRALRKAGLANPIQHCVDGDEALAFLFGQTNQGRMAPLIVLLDLNLPGIDGREVLRAIKSSKEHKDIPVIVLTTSKDDRDINDSYRAGANSYIQKPVNIGGFVNAIQALKEYWFEIAILPRSD